MTQKTPSLSEYYDKLVTHDWFYSYSDDHSVWQRGEAAMSNLVAEYKDKPEFKELYDAFVAYHFSGDAYGTPKAPYPERPKENVFRTGESN